MVGSHRCAIPRGACARAVQDICNAKKLKTRFNIPNNIPKTTYVILSGYLLLTINHIKIYGGE